jgi:transcriptional regulator with XRE-family HTH domain
MPIQTIFAERLKAARNRAGLSQKQLGILAGIDEFAASARMNQYERSKHLPDLDTAKRLADALDIPMAYLYCPEDDLAELLLLANKVSDSRLRQLTKTLRTE